MCNISTAQAAAWTSFGARPKASAVQVSKTGRTLLPPAVKENAVALIKAQGEKALNEWLALLPSVAGKEAPSAGAKKSGNELSETDKAVCQILNLTDEEFKKGM